MMWPEGVDKYITNNKTHTHKNTTQKKKKQQVMIVKRSTHKTHNNYSNKYKFSLMHPFDTEATGTQVPDMYSFPTSTFHAKGTVVLGSDASGNGQAWVTGNPFCAMGSLSVSSSSMAPYTSSPNIYASTGVTTMQGAFSNFRVVSYGFKIRNQQPILGVTGRVFIAPVPVAGLSPGPEVLQNAVADYKNMLQLQFGTIWNGGVLNSQLLTLPGAQEFSLQEVIGDEIILLGRPLSTNPFEFRALSGTAYNATQELVQNTLSSISTPTLTVNGDTFATSDGRGTVAFLIYFSGVPVSTTNILEIEYVYHYEGTPVVTNTGALNSGSAPAPYVSLNMFHDALTCLHDTECIQKVQSNTVKAARAVSTAANMAGRAYSYMYPSSHYAIMNG